MHRHKALVFWIPGSGIGSGLKLSLSPARPRVHVYVSQGGQSSANMLAR